MKLRTAVLATILPLCLISCKKEKQGNENTTVQQEDALNSQVTNLQKEIGTVSNKIEGQLLDPSATYTSPQVAPNIEIFKSLRTEQKQKLNELSSMGKQSSIERLVCADFEEMECFIDNWDVLKESDQTLKFDTSTSYNNSNSLYLSSPHKMGAINQRSLSINGYINNIETQTVYKIRFWAKYKGFTSKDNGPLLGVIIEQDNKWLGYKYIVVGDGSYTDKDWNLYSFQIITETNSPLDIQLFTNMQDCWVDDLYIVKKTD